MLERGRLPVTETVVMTAGKRILFAIPWGERLILGTTDTDHAGPPDAVSVEPSDLTAVLQVANQFFPRAALTAEDVRSTWAGLRPLIADPRGKPSDISRAHEIRNPEPGWWDVAGGKLTTYRLMAEQTLDRIVDARQLDRSTQPCRTASEPLLPAAETLGSGILPPPLSRAAVEHYCGHEWALHLDDVMLRRSGWQHYLPNPATAAEQVAQWMGDLLGWIPAQRTAELSRPCNWIGTHCAKCLKSASVVKMLRLCRTATAQMSKSTAVP